MTIEQQYQAYLDKLAAKQQANPSYPDIEWYAHTGQADKMEEIIKYGRVVPKFEPWLEAQLETEEA